MAEIINSSLESRVVQKSYSIWRIATIGAILGTLYWILTSFVGRYTSNMSIAGNVSTIIIATIGLIIMVSQRMTRPLLVVIASAVTLWGLSDWTNDLVWFEVVIWNVIIYGLAYLLFSWIARYKDLVPISIAIVIIAIIVRITITI